jgi:hypothetical protein
MALDREGSLYGGGDGSSFEQAVIINTNSTEQGIPAEYEYVGRLFGRMGVDWDVVRQSLVSHDGRQYDVLQIKLSNGEEKYIYFDIIQFFGKP